MSARFSSFLKSATSASRGSLSYTHPQSHYHTPSLSSTLTPFATTTAATRSPILSSYNHNTTTDLESRKRRRRNMSTQPPTTKEGSGSASPFLDAVTARRSNYTLTPTSSIPDSRIQEILTTALEQCPSTFGSYTTRLVLLLKDEHFKFWDLATSIIQSVTPPEQFNAHTKARLEGFRNAYGTVLYFEDPENTRKLQDAYAFAKDHFPVWAQHTSAIHQFVVWTALTSEGMGANLQHYNPLIDEKVKAEWGVPATWDLVAQMPFGVPSEGPKPKPTHMKKGIEETLFVHGA